MTKQALDRYDDVDRVEQDTKQSCTFIGRNTVSESDASKIEITIYAIPPSPDAMPTMLAGQKNICGYANRCDLKTDRSSM